MYKHIGKGRNGTLPVYPVVRFKTLVFNVYKRVLQVYGNRFQPFPNAVFTTVQALVLGVILRAGLLYINGGGVI